MTPKERWNRILQGDAVEPICICPGGMMNMVTQELMQKVQVFLPQAHYDARQMASLAKAVYEQGCFENYGVPFCMTVEAQAMGAKIEDGSEIYEPHVVEYPIGSTMEYGQLTELDCKVGRCKVVLDAIRLLKEEKTDIPIIGNLTGPLSVATSLLEPVILYKEMRKKSEQVHRYLSWITDQLIVFALAQIEAGADVIAISDPSATGEILGPKYFEEFAVQYLNRIVDAIHQTNRNVIVHICGQMHAVYPQVQQIRSDVLSFDSIVSLKEAKLHLPKRILMGNVSTFALEFATPEKVIQLTKHAWRQGASIVSPACGLGMKSPLVNVQMMLASCMEERKSEESNAHMQI
jgi:[methyl-Co(III) methanol-specific corrinoid protein]:coenzyme M methyltransferase